jgi:ankyrin repeat protein
MTLLYESTLLLLYLKDSLIKPFLDAGADVNLHNECGDTALHGAVKVGNTRVVRTLLDGGMHFLLE